MRVWANQGLLDAKYKIDLGEYRVYKLPVYPGPYGDQIFFYIVEKSNDALGFTFMAPKQRFNLSEYGDMVKDNGSPSGYDKIIEQIIESLKITEVNTTDSATAPLSTAGYLTYRDTSLKYSIKHPPDFVRVFQKNLETPEEVILVEKKLLGNISPNEFEFGEIPTLRFGPTADESEFRQWEEMAKNNRAIKKKIGNFDTSYWFYKISEDLSDVAYFYFAYTPDKSRGFSFMGENAGYDKIIENMISSLEITN